MKILVFSIKIVIISDVEDHHQVNPSTSVSAEQKQKASKYNGNFVEKIKMAFLNERRKSTFSKKRMNSNGTSSSSSDELDRSDTFFDLSNHPLTHTLSRQSTHNNNLAGIAEEITSNLSH